MLPRHGGSLATSPTLWLSSRETVAGLLLALRFLPLSAVRAALLIIILGSPDRELSLS